MSADQFNRILNGYKLTGFVVVDDDIELLFNKAEEAFPINIVKEQIV